MKRRRNQLMLDRSRGSVRVMLFASLLVGAGPLFALPHTTCVNNAADFRSELVNASGLGINNDADNYINDGGCLPNHRVLIAAVAKRLHGAQCTCGTSE
jgi:hypothetical protein